jgi:hypothetical protein
MVNPKLIIESDVRIQAINVRSAAIRVRVIAASVRSWASLVDLSAGVSVDAS